MGKVQKKSVFPRKEASREKFRRLFEQFYTSISYRNTKKKRRTSSTTTIKSNYGVGRKRKTKKMFNSLANYILGTLTNVQTEQAAGVVEETNLRLTPATADDDDDWLLVDRDSEGNSEISSDDECGDEIGVLPSKTATRTSSTSSLPCATMMDESWFVTPPPCFTSAGPAHMETSPLENLLIEHPSMSVYQHSGHFTALIVNRRRNSSLPRTVQVEEVVQPMAEAAAVVDDDVEQPPVEVNRRNHRNEVVHRLEKQTVLLRQSQKVQGARKQQYLKHRRLERNNKAREVNTRNRRLRRGERSQGANRSHANNNRKC